MTNGEYGMTNHVTQWPATQFLIPNSPKNPTFAPIMTTEYLKDMRDRVLVLRRFL